MGFWDAVASAGPYANNLHLPPDRQQHRHLITQFFYRSDALPTSSVKTLVWNKWKRNEQDKQLHEIMQVSQETTINNILCMCLLLS